MTPPRVPRRRLTKDEWEAELARAKGVQAADVDWRDEAKAHLLRIQREEIEPMLTGTGRHPAVIQYGSNACVCGETASAGCHYSDALIVDDPSPNQLRVRTGRRRSWWQRGWKR